MSMSDLFPSGNARPPRDLILSALDDAIVYRTADFAFCHDCERAIDGLCSLHRGDSALADDYEATRTRIRAGDLTALISGVTT